MTDDIDKMLKYDALSEAEKLTGKSYKEDEDTGFIGMFLHQVHGDAKKDALKATRDSYWGMPYEEFLAIATELGFKIVYHETGQYKEGEEASTQHRHVFWRDGVLLDTESYSWSASEVRSVNNAKIRYNWQVSPAFFSNRTAFMSSGSWSKESVPGSGRNDILVGDHDVREGFRNTINKLDAHGDFLSPWLEAPHLWLTAYWNKADEGLPWREQVAMYDAETKAIVDKLPEDVRTALNWGPRARA